MANRAIAAFVGRVNEYRILNCSSAPVVAACSGTQITFPAINQIVDESSATANKFVSMKDDKGNYVPGTLVVKDIYNKNKLVWDAKEAMKVFLGISPSGSLDSSFAICGFRLVPEDVTPEEFAAIRAEGLEAWENWATTQAQHTVADFMVRVSRQQAAGLPPPMAPPYVQEAKKLLDIVSKKRNQSLKEMFGEMSEPVSAVLQSKQLEEQKAQLKAELLKDKDFVSQLLAAAVVAPPVDEPAPARKRA
jgi:hypothetical protein